MKKVLYFLPFIFSTTAIAQIQAVGDTMLGSDITISEKLLKPVEHIFQNPNYINMINLEGVVTNKSYPKKCSSGTYCYVFQMPEKTISILAQNNIHIANLANNHSMDLGEHGQRDTAKLLLEENIKPIGLQEKYTEKKLQWNGQSYIFIGLSPHKNTNSIFELQQMKHMVEKYKKEGNIIVISAHMGAEGENQNKIQDKEEYFLGANRGNPVKVARELIDSGADLFIGHGPHVMRPMELYKNRLIVYSLGNFLTYGTFNLKGKSGLGGIIRVDLEQDGSFKEGQFFGYQQTKNSQPQLWAKGTALVPSQESLNFLKDMTKNYQPLAFEWKDNGKFLPLK